MKRLLEAHCRQLNDTMMVDEVTLSGGTIELLDEVHDTLAGQGLVVPNFVLNYYAKLFIKPMWNVPIAP